MKPDQILSARVPKAFWIPSKNKFISTGAMVQIYKFCKANPGMPVKESISGWWQSTTDEVLAEIQKGIHERIYLRQFIKSST